MSGRERMNFRAAKWAIRIGFMAGAFMVVFASLFAPMWGWYMAGAIVVYFVTTGMIEGYKDAQYEKGLITGNIEGYKDAQKDANVGTRPTFMKHD